MAVSSPNRMMSNEEITRERNEKSLTEKARSAMTLLLLLGAISINVLATLGKNWSHHYLHGITEGLWEQCTLDDRCTVIGSKQVLRRYCQYISLISCGLSTLSACVLFLMMIKKGLKRGRVVAFIVMPSLALSIFQMVTYTIMMKQNFSVKFGRSYLFGWINVGFLFLASITLHLKCSASFLKICTCCDSQCCCCEKVAKEEPPVTFPPLPVLDGNAKYHYFLAEV